MKEIVIYQSATGFTKQYAEWIGERLHCDVSSIKDLSKLNLDSYDHIFYGGWIMGNLVTGLDKIRKVGKEPDVVFGVGSSSPDFEEVIAQIKELNHLQNTKFFYLQGGFRFEELALWKRLLLKTLKKSLTKKSSLTPQEEYMLQKLGTSYDCSDPHQIDSFITYIDENLHTNN